MRSGTSSTQTCSAFQQRVRKWQPDGGFAGRRHVALQHDALPALPGPGVGQRHGRQQRLRVGVQGLLVDLLVVADLDDAPEVHHRDAVGDVAHHRQVVGDEDVGELELLLELLQQVDDLRLHRDVERRHRLVADDDLGVERQCPRHADALALPAGELVRVAVLVVGVEADPVQQRAHLAALLLARHHARWISYGLADDVADRHARVQRGVGVLEDDLDVGGASPAGPAGRARRCPCPRRSPGPPVGSTRRSSARDERRLAAAGLADQAERLPAVQRRSETSSTALTCPDRAS